MGETKGQQKPYRLTVSLTGNSEKIIRGILRSRRAMIVDYALLKVFENYDNDKGLQAIAGHQNPLGS